MIHLANILIADADAANAQALLQQIRAHGYTGRAVNSIEAVLSVAQQEQPDLILAGTSLQDGDVYAMARAVKQTAGCFDIPICVVAAIRSADIKPKALAAGIDDVLAPPIDETKLVARLRPLVRLSIMSSELQRRAATARHFGVEASGNVAHPNTEGNYPVLLVGSPSVDLATMLPEAQLTVAGDPFEADDFLGQQNFDLALLSPKGKPGPYLDLCAQIRNNPRLFNLPVLFIGSHVSDADVYRHGASGRLSARVDSAELQAAVLFLVRRQRYRWALRQAISMTLQTTTRDAATGVYSRAFLDRYLPERVSFASSHGRHLSVMFFRVPDVEGIGQRFGEEQAEHLRLQVAQWITGLLRGEDLTARFEENEFCVVLPDTPSEEAVVVMNRIAGVLAYTDFAVKEVYHPVKVWVRCGIADFQSGDSVTSLIDRARQDIL